MADNSTLFSPLFPAEDKHLVVNISILLISGFRGFLKWTSDLGGLMGIWFGASFASIVEIIELISDLLMIAFKNKYVNQVNS